MSPADREAVRRLRLLWDQKKRQLGITQEKVAEQFGRSQALIAHYLNGHTPIGPVATLKFARLLQCQPTDIRPDFQYGMIVPAELPPDVIEMAIKLASVPEAVRRDIIGFVNVTLQNGRYVDWVVETDNKKPASLPLKKAASGTA